MMPLISESSMRRGEEGTRREERRFIMIRDRLAHYIDNRG
jgi:hypothetical protein